MYVHHFTNKPQLYISPTQSPNAFFLTPIVLGEVKVDLANFDLKFQQTSYVPDLYEKITISAETSCSF